MNLASISSDVSFLDRLAHAWLDVHKVTPWRGMILLPTRRAARALSDAFLRASDGKAMLLPRITALGALDEAPLALAGVLDLPPAIAPLDRLAGLTRLILRLPSKMGGAGSADRAWMLAQELARLMDEAERSEKHLADVLAKAADTEHAQHWAITLEFLRIVTEIWPAHLHQLGLINPAARQVALLNAQAEIWRTIPPADPIWAAGMTSFSPAVARVLRVLAESEHGLVVLPGLDMDLPDDVWGLLDDAHPQAGLSRLLAGMDATRGDVRVWGHSDSRCPGRAGLLSLALLPAPAIHVWQTQKQPSTAGLSLLDCADQAEEAVAIAMILRDALATPGQRAALVTPDRGLAGRVAAELLRWDIIADDSAGEPLAQTPPAVFLRLLAQAIADDLAPVALLALLKHPLAGLGMTTAACRAATRRLERDCLRGPAPEPGLAGLRRRAVKADATVHDLLDRLETCLHPLLALSGAGPVRVVQMLTRLVEAAEALATTDTHSGPARLWALEEGEALAVLLSEALVALDVLPDQRPDVLPGLLDALLQPEAVRSRRDLRGRDAVAEHPRVFIWGLLEARLQAIDVMVLGGLSETVWPPATDPGPWLSRPMRRKAGLPSAEEMVGQAAHDFVACACSAPSVVLSAPRRRDRAPAVPARWLVRLEALLGEAGLPRHAAAIWARQLDQPAGQPKPVAAPMPRPSVALRPRSLSVTEIQTWLEDPYAIYACHVLKLKPLDPLEQGTDALDYGTLVHDGLKLFLNANMEKWPPDATARLRAAMDHALEQSGLRRAVTEWWRPRLYRIADWVGEQEVLRRAQTAPIAIAPEIAGNWLVQVPGGFNLIGRADRIERRADGTLSILDYKTGQVPTQRAVAAGFAPQLPLEAAMAAAGAFGADWEGTTVELVYWHLTGGFHPGKATPLFQEDPTHIVAAAEEARDRLCDLIISFDNPDRAYLSQPNPANLPRYANYAQLARVAERAQAGDEE